MLVTDTDSSSFFFAFLSTFLSTTNQIFDILYVSAKIDLCLNLMQSDVCKENLITLECCQMSLCFDRNACDLLLSRNSLWKYLNRNTAQLHEIL